MKNFLKYKNWYSDTERALKKLYGADYKLMAGLISSTSPRFSIKRNIKTAQSVYKDFKENPILFLSYIENHKAEFLKVYKLLNSHYNNIVKCLKHDFENPLVLSGQKVNAFYQNITGNKEAVTLDIWMMRYFNHNQAWLNIGDYKRYSEIIKRLGEREGLYPCEIQAVIWTKIRAEYGFKPLNFCKFL